ncbi:hypothetical protein EDB84DRAFT_1560525 [Lactarius hengduanensis]|nr:hypothetical protein EDB84DRAFT_1563522 [Lactarius hengduanensis]KAH9037776.1 hypothetical protein EDB84DRAFT_1560525 [Lactarius hengduanensis]
MPATYAQLIESVLTDVAKEGWEHFSLSWLRQRIRIQARRVKRRLGPRLNRFIRRTLEHEAQLGYLHLQDIPRGLSIYMSAGGRYEYIHRATAVTIVAQPLSSASSASKTRDDLLRENNKMKDELLKIETRLARANSLIDTEDCANVGMVTGAPAAVTERIQRLVVLSKNRKHQISLMYEAEQHRYHSDFINEDYERGVEEARREACVALFGEYHD